MKQAVYLVIVLYATPAYAGETIPTFNPPRAQWSNPVFHPPQHQPWSNPVLRYDLGSFGDMQSRTLGPSVGERFGNHLAPKGRD